MPLVLKRRRGQSVVIGDADDAMIVSVRTATRGAAQFDCEPQRGRRGHRVRRRAGESFMVGEHVRVTVLDACRGSTKLSFEAPSHIAVNRQEVHDAKCRARPLRTLAASLATCLVGAALLTGVAVSPAARAAEGDALGVATRYYLSALHLDAIADSQCADVGLPLIRPDLSALRRDIARSFGRAGESVASYLTSESLAANGRFEAQGGVDGWLSRNTPAEVDHRAACAVFITEIETGYETHQAAWLALLEAARQGDAEEGAP